MEEVGNSGLCFPAKLLHSDFLLINKQLEADKKAVVHLIFPYHGNQGFGLCVNLCTGNVLELARHFLFGAFLCCPYAGFSADLQGVNLPVPVLGDKLPEGIVYLIFLFGA